METDVLICGYGLGGLTSAYFCNKLNIKHLVIERNKFPGGVANLGGGGIVTSNNVGKTFQYLKHTNNHLRSDAHTRVMAQGMYDLTAEVREIASRVGALVDEFEVDRFKYDFPGEESITCSELHGLDGAQQKKINPYLHLENDDLTIYRGWQTVHYLSSLNERDGTNVIYDCVAKKIDQVRKVLTTSKGDIQYKKLIMATGGYEDNRQMQLENFETGRADDILNYGTWFNKGDGVKMLNNIGAMNYHMWHFHGSYAFRHPEDPMIGVRIRGMSPWMVKNKHDSGKKSYSKVRHIIVDQKGKRFMNEHHPFPADTSHRPFYHNDKADVINDRIPSFFISDEWNRRLGPYGCVRYISEKNFNYTKWSHHNIDEMKNGILNMKKNYKELADYIGCEEKEIRNTIEAWNESVKLGHDDLFDRPKEHMRELKPPFIVGKLFPMVGNTQGGPKHNEYSQVLDSFDDPIDDVYAVGELGSWWSHLYLSSGNWAETFIRSKQAVKHIKDTLS